MTLHGLLRETARRTPHAVAVRHGDESASYRELDELAAGIAHALLEIGVSPGDRVGIWMDKSILAVAATQGVLRAGAAYVPIDPASPRGRARKVLEDCDARAVIVGEDRGIDGIAVVRADRVSPRTASFVHESAPDDLAYVLYTSGSTGNPKGVCISHSAALAFVGWARETLAASPHDRLANHAPLHFDLSVLDVYVTFAAGAQLVLVPQVLALAPQRLVDLIVRERVSIWYSVPSVLAMMIDRGDLLARGPADLRAVMFAGEVCPIKYVRMVRERWPDVRLWNLYGPTETNVCTAYEVVGAADALPPTLPIGRATCGDSVQARRTDGSLASPGEEGELFVTGPTVMRGYFGQPRLTGPYATGDWVRVLPDGGFEYRGRHDRMLKVSGHRIEPAEIEAALLSHERIREAAVIAEGTGLEARLVALLGVVGEPLSLLAVKRHLAERLPRAMIVDRIRCIAELPRNANGKVDYGRVAALLAAEHPR